MIDVNDTEPMPGPDGADLLNEIYKTLKKYVVFANGHQVVAVSLWIVATHAMSAWNHATRLVIHSPQKRCGKSRLLDVIALLCHNSLMAANATTAALFRSVGENDDETPTILFDEADALFSSKRVAEQNEDLRSFFNAGWQRGRVSLRCVGPQQIPTRFNTFAMAALAAIGHLPDTITDRAVNINLQRRAPQEKVSQYRILRDGMPLNALRGQITAWVRDEDRMKRLTDDEPAMPTEDRAADAWEPFFAIANEAGADWPGLVYDACKALESAGEEDEDGSLETKLLIDIRRVFIEQKLPFLPSTDLVSALRRIEESPWETFDLTPNNLAYRLRNYRIKPGHNTAKTARGYRLEQFHDAFTRYTRPNPSDSSETHDDQQQRWDGSDSTEIPDRPNRPDGHGTDTLGRPDEIYRPTERAAQSAFRTTWTVPDAPCGENGQTEPGHPVNPGKSDPARTCSSCGLSEPYVPLSEYSSLCLWCDGSRHKKCRRCETASATPGGHARCQPCQDESDHQLAEFFDGLEKRTAQ